jgi:hypothetical protein
MLVRTMSRASSAPSIRTRRLLIRAAMVKGVLGPKLGRRGALLGLLLQGGQPARGVDHDVPSPVMIPPLAPVAARR